MNIILSNELLAKFELKNQDFLVDKNYYDLKSGQQEYRLYSYLSTLFNNITILDIGTSSIELIMPFVNVKYSGKETTTFCLFP